MVVNGGFSYSFGRTPKELGSPLAAGSGYIFRGITFMDPRTKLPLWAMQLESSNDKVLVFRDYVKDSFTDADDERYAMYHGLYVNVD